MKPLYTLTLLALAAGLFAAQARPAEAFMSVFLMADRVIKQETKKAIATPGHTQWCARQAPGYRAKWNNWRLPNGRVKYCASPYFTPIWMKGLK